MEVNFCTFELLIVTSTCTYVLMGRKPCIFTCEIEHTKRNIHSDVSIQRSLFYEKTEIVDKYRGFWAWGVQKMLRFFRYVFSCMYDLHVFYRGNRVLHTWIEGLLCVETSEL